MIDDAHFGQLSHIVNRLNMVNFVDVAPSPSDGATAIGNLPK